MLIFDDFKTPSKTFKVPIVYLKGMNITYFYDENGEEVKIPPPREHSESTPLPSFTPKRRVSPTKTARKVPGLSQSKTELHSPAKSVVTEEDVSLLEKFYIYSTRFTPPPAGLGARAAPIPTRGEVRKRLELIAKRPDPNAYPKYLEQIREATSAT